MTRRSLSRVHLDLDPCPAPRQTRSDAWDPRDSVQRYRAFRDRVWLLTAKRRHEIPWGGLKVTFYVPMPPSWSQKKSAAMEGRPHQQKPDLDNLVKALLDSLWPNDDTHCWDLHARKLWSQAGSILIEWEKPDA